MALPTLRIIGFIIGIFLITLAIAMVIPMATLVFFDRSTSYLTQRIQPVSTRAHARRYVEGVCVPASQAACFAQHFS